MTSYQPVDYATKAVADLATQGEFDPEAIKAAAKRGASGSLLVQMALILGMVADKMMEKIQDLALELGKVQDANIQASINKQPTDKGSENQLSATLQAQTQILNMYMQALSNAIKTVGEGAATTARKG